MASLMDLRRMMLTDPMVPPAYKRVEYIRSAGSAYIITDYIPVQNDEIGVTYQVDNAAIRAGTSCLFSAGNGTYQLISLAYYSTSYACPGQYCKYFASGSAAPIISGELDDVWYTLSVDSAGAFRVNGEVARKPYEHELDGTAVTLWIFKRRNNASPYTGKLKSFKITNSGTTKLNLIPCVRRSDGVAGAYDTVSKTFYTSASSEAFLVS